MTSFKKDHLMSQHANSLGENKLQHLSSQNIFLKMNNSILDTNTTEEEFKKMENAVNNLLTTKMQIDQLKNERSSLIQIYEAKLNEQNEQINYLQNENEKLQFKLNNLNQTGICNQNSNCNCAQEHNNWRKTYEPLLENLIKQLYNALKIQESIRVEYFKLEKCQLKLSYSNSANTNAQNDSTGNFSFSTSNSWTFNAANNNPNERVQNNFETITKFQDLLAQQQKYQLNLLNELSQITMSLKITNEATQNKKSKTPSLPPQHFPLSFNEKIESLIKNDSKNHSDNINQMKTVDSNVSNSHKSSNNLNKPSKIPKYQKSGNPSNSSSNEIINISKANDADICSKLKSLAIANSKIPLRQQATQSSASQLADPLIIQAVNLVPNYNTYVKKSKNSTTPESKPKTPCLVNSSTFSKKPIDIPVVSNKEVNEIQCLTKKVPVRDEGYSTLSNEIMNHIRMNHTTNNATVSCTSTSSSSSGSNDKQNDSGIRISRASGDSSSSSSHMTSARTTSSSSTSSNHSPRMLNSIINEEILCINQNQNLNSPKDQISTSDNDASSNISSCSTSSHDKCEIKHLRINREIKKRYCFPTLKSFSYYYNNRYYHQSRTKNCIDNTNTSSLALVSSSVVTATSLTVNPTTNDNKIHNVNNQNNSDSNICCKYLSESDLTSLANQLSAYDKDLTYNVYHLDTLYNNVDYILFNSYASDTELVYNYNRRHGKNQHFLNSNYKLYINDYFNQPYDEDEHLEEDEDEKDLEEIESNQPRDKEEEEVDNDLNRLVDYELKYDMEDNQFEYDFNDYQYGNYEDEDEDDDDNNEDIIELNVDDDEYEDGLLFDDDNLDDVNLLLVMKSNANSVTHQHHLEQFSSIDDECDSYKKVKIYDTNYDDCFCNPAESDDLIITSTIFSSESINNSCVSNCMTDSSSSSTSSTCSTCSGSSSGSLSSFSSELSMDSINENAKSPHLHHHIRKIKPKVSNVRRLAAEVSSPNRSNQRHNRVKHKKNKNQQRRHHHHRQHDYFIDDNFDECENMAVTTTKSNKINQYSNFNDEFNIDDFVQELNFQCNIDERLIATKKASDRLKELNILAARALTNNSQLDQEDLSCPYNLDNSFSTKISKPNLTRRHTIQSMPTSAAACLVNFSSNNANENEINETKLSNNIKFISPPIQNVQPISPCQYNIDSKAYVGSFNQVLNSPHRKYSSLKQKNEVTTLKICDQQMKTQANSNIEETKTNNVPKKVNNNFNNEFYRLCSGDTFESENNLNGWTQSNSSLQIQKNLHIQKLNAIEKQHQQQQERSNLTDHVNTLFDQWLINSNMNIPTKCNGSIVTKH